ncbi:RNA polymerase sigma factor [Mycobacterium heidelbergense]|uniref:RNA polymerase sigma factor n=1 Tax=Mycobacterium heidelbergense TaxID=53376 RepID=UPI003CF0D486
MTALPDWNMAGDAELAGAAVAGDRAAFAGIYDRYADRLHDFCVGMVRDRDAAADCVQEVFCTAAAQLSTLRDPDKLRPWLYAIARNEALRCIRLRRRENVADELPEAQSFDAGPDTLARRTELAELVAEAAGGLSDRDRAVLELSYRHGLDGPELAAALDVSPDNATKLVSRMRDTVERSLGALLVARRAHRNPQGCPELGAILANWDGKFTVLLRKRVARHIDSCATCERKRRDLVSPAALLGVAPIFVAAPWWLRGQTLTKVQLTSADTAMGADTGDSHADAVTEALHQQGGASAGQPHPEASRRARHIQAATVLVGIVFVALGLMFLLLHHQKTAVAPSDVTVNTPPPAGPNTPPAAITMPPPEAPPPQAPPAPNTPGPVNLPAPPPANPPPPAAPIPNSPLPPPAAPPPVVVPVPVPLPLPPPVRATPPSYPAPPPTTTTTIAKPIPPRYPPSSSQVPVPPRGPIGRIN